MKYSFCFLLLFFLLSCKKEIQIKDITALKAPRTTVKKDTLRAPQDTPNEDLIVEFCVIDDPDGYTYVRDMNMKTGKITDTLKNGTL